MGGGTGVWVRVTHGLLCAGEDGGLDSRPPPPAGMTHLALWAVLR